MARRDLTNDSIAEGILSLSLPMIAGSVLQASQSLIDMFFVSRLGPKALAAVGMSGTVLMLLMTAFIGLHVATAAMVARAFGAQDRDGADHAAGQAFLLSLLLSAAVAIVGFLASERLLTELAPKADQKVIRLAAAYLHVMFTGIFFTCAYFLTAGVFRACGDAMTPFVIAVLATVLNMILTPLLIFGHLGFPALGVRGSAVATVASQAVGFAIALYLLTRDYTPLNIRWKHLKPDVRVLWRITVIGVPSAAQMSLRTLMNLALLAIVATFGDLVVAAYTVGMRIRMLGMFPFFGFAVSAATMVGQNLGAGKPERSERSAWTAAAMAFGVACIGAAAFITFAPAIIRVFSDKPEVVAPGTAVLRIGAAGMLAASVAIVMSRALTGAGDTVSPFVISLICLWGFQIPAAIYLSGTREISAFGLNAAVPGEWIFRRVSLDSPNGVWWAMVAASVLHAAIVTAWFMTGRWKHKTI